jgi:integrase
VSSSALRARPGHPVRRRAAQPMPPPMRVLAQLLRQPVGADDTAAAEIDAELAEVAAEAAANVAAEAVEAELAADVVNRPALDDLTVDRVLDVFLNERGWLVPARLAETTDLGDGTLEDRTRRLERARLLDQLRANAWADGTLSSYGGHVRAWRAWCAEEGVPALPFDPQQVASHLLDYAFIWDEDAGDFLRDIDRGLMPAVTAGTVGIRLAALNLAAAFIGMPRPGDNAGIQELMRGVRRRLGVAPAHRAAALDLSRIDACLTAATGARYAATRNRAALLTRARTGATAGQLAAMGWPGVTLEATQVTLELASTHRHGTPTVVVVPAHANPDLCLVRTLRELRTMAVRLDRVFAHPAISRSRSGAATNRTSGGPMSRQALHRAVHAAADLEGGWEAVPGLADRELARLLRTGCPVTPLVMARDRALLLAGFWTAARRSNLSALNWRDVTDHGDDGLAAVWRRSKTDQEGRSKTKWIPQAAPGSEKACPATALRAWKAQLTTALGRPPRPDEPVFVTLTGAGTVKLRNDRPVRLTGDAINDVVQKLAVAAGLMTKPKPGEKATFSAHSLRSGFVTEGLRGDKLSIPEVQDVTDHKTVSVLVGYRREVNGAKTNAARKLLGS